MKKILLLGAAVALVPAAPAMAGQGLRGCTLSGVATLSPGLKANQPGPGPGTAIVQWGNGSLSVVDYATDGVAAAIGLTGDYRNGPVTLTRVDKGPNGETLTDSFPLRFGGDYAGGPLAFRPADPTQCETTGVTESPITGTLFHGNYE